MSIGSQNSIEMKRIVLLISIVLAAVSASAKDHRGITSESSSAESFALIVNSQPTPVLICADETSGARIAARNLCADFGRVCGTPAELVETPVSGRMIIAGTIGCGYINSLAEAGKIDGSALKGKVEKYLMTVVPNPVDGVEEALVIAGSDMRGAIYGIYELSEQLGVSPWYDWMDVPVEPKTDLYIARGTYTAGEPAVRYRGLFLNDEAPCLTTWVKNTYGTDYGDHRFYARVFELILRLRGNFMWPAMWGWAFYADDPLNSATANEMGVIMGTSHHEPMARNHQEWARHRDEYGEWDYVTNKKVLDTFFREGMERAKDTEDLITIGMRGDGDAAMGAKEGHDDEFVDNDLATIKLLEKIVTNQRKIIRQVTGRPSEERPQVWALYKEVQRYYDKGLKVPDDAIILLSDDNWGDIRRLPSKEELAGHSGGFGMYYHVDYVGAPRNSKWLNITPIQHIWDQLELTWQYGVNKLWVLNVGDLKPMEYPISLFMELAWNPDRFTASNLLEHPLQFCEQQFGPEQAPEAARILNQYSQYAGRVTAEMLDRNTYNIESGEWKTVADEFMKLETEALRQFISLPEQYRDAYRQLILFPVQALGNVYQMYYAQAMNHKLFKEGNPEANLWADKVEAAFKRDAELCREYNEDIAGGKWDGMMIQKHIGYYMWNDDFPADKLPEIHRFAAPEQMLGGYTFSASDGAVIMDAEHFFSATDADEAEWTIIPFMGRTRSGISLQPYDTSVEGASISYRFIVPEEATSAKIHVITASTLAFARKEGHRYALSIDGGERAVVNFNEELNEEPENVYRIMYPTVASRVIEKTVEMPLTGSDGRYATLTIEPLDPGVVLEKIVIDFGGYTPGFLFGNESPCVRK